MTSRKVIDIANSLEFVNDYNNNGITENNSRISTSEYGQLFLYSTTPSVNSSTATVVLYNGGLSINCTMNTTNLTSGGSLTVRGGASFEKSIRVGDSGYITNVISTNSSTSTLNVTGLTAGNINFTGDLYQNGSLYVSSQWSSSGGNLFIPATNGNVGIATTSPAYTLDVNGTVNSNNMISTNITTSVLNASGITSGNINFTGDLYKNGNIYISSQWKDEADGALSFTGGNIGIGNSSPDYKLDITGNLRVNATNLSIIISQNNSNVLQIQNNSISGNSSIQFADNSGNTKLFTGYANVSSSLVSLAGSSYILSDTAVSLKLVAGNRTSSPVILNANDNSVSITTTTDATDIYSGALKVSGGAGIANQLYVGDDLHVNRDLYVNGSITGAAASSSTFAYLTLTATDDAINLSTGSLVTFGGITIQSTTDSNSLTDGGSFLTAGGASIQKTLRVGTGIITENISSTNISSTNISTNSINVSSITSTMLTTGNIVANNLNLGISNMFSGSFAFGNNTNVPANVDGLSCTDTRSFTVNLSVSIESSGGNLHETFILDANQTESQWYLYTTGYGDDSGIVFSITNLGQIQYTSTNISGFTNGIFRFFVNQISNTGNYTYAGSQTQGTLITNTIQILSTADSNIGINNGSLYLAGGATVSKTLYAVNITSSNVKVTNITSNAARITTGITTGSINANDGIITNGTITNLLTTNVSIGTLDVIGITAGNINFTGSLYQNDSIYISSQWLSGTGGNLSYTNGNIGIGNTSPSFSLDVSGTARITSGITTSTLLVTNVSTGTVNASTGITTAALLNTGLTSTANLAATTATIPNIIITNVSIGTVNVTGITTAALLNTGLTSTANLAATTATIPNIVITNVSVGTLSASTITGGNLSLSGDLIVGGTLTTVNITSTNILNTNISIGTIIATGLSALQNVTVTNISAGTLNASTGITTGTINASGLSVLANATATNASIGTVNLSTGITTAALLNTGLISSANLASTTATIPNIINTNISAGTINVTGITAASAQITNLNVTTSTITTNLISLGNSNTVGNIFTTGGNVGINTGSPGSSLHVAGNIPFSPVGGGVHMGIDSNTYTSIQLNSTAGSYIDFGTSGGDYQSRIIAGDTGNLSISTNGASNNGYVGINTASPEYTLDVSGTGRFTGKLTITGSAGTTGFDTATNDQYADMRVIRNSTSSLDKDMYIQNGAGATSTLHLFSNNSETMTLKSGNVGISTTAPSGMLHLNNAALFTSTGNLTCTGDIISFGNLSDRRLKENIFDISNDVALDTVRSLRPVTFNWRDDIFNESKRGILDVGFIAQEVEPLIPLAVSEYTQINTGDVYKNIKHERLIPYLVGAIQRLDYDNEVKQREINDLKKSLLNLMERINK